MLKDSMLLINLTKKQERKPMSTSNSTSSIWIVVQLHEYNLPSFESKYSNSIVGTYPTQSLAQEYASLRIKTHIINAEPKRPKYFIMEVNLTKDHRQL